MKKQLINNVRLGVFVLAGLFFLVLILYMIGKNSNLFGNTYELRARFKNIQGLVVGNNVRYAGIETGTVKKIEILNDTVIEVTMVIEEEMLSVIRKNAMVTIGTEGLVGNKVINILPAGPTEQFAEAGDLLVTHKSMDTDEMLLTLNETNDEIAIIADELKSTIQRLNNSTALWDLLNDQSISEKLRSSLSHIQLASKNAGLMTSDLRAMVADVKNGEGLAGQLLKDTTLMAGFNETLTNFKEVGNEANSLINEIDRVLDGIENDINNGKGPANALLKDTIALEKLNASLDNIQKGTDNFNQNMEAMKHNFLFRGYFKKQEKEARRAEKSKGKTQ